MWIHNEKLGIYKTQLITTNTYDLDVRPTWSIFPSTESSHNGEYDELAGQNLEKSPSERVNSRLDNFNFNKILSW